MLRLKKILYFLILLAMISCENQKETGTIAYLETRPKIDGLLDRQLENLDQQKFNHIWQFDNPVTDTVAVNYRMAYTADHLYLYIEADADSINYRRRGFVNGDGFKLLIANPRDSTSSSTPEYYDIVFSASKDKDYWARKRIWDQNHDQSKARPLSKKSEFQELAADGKSGFEALIAWEDIPPYHPWLQDEIGYNLYFAKAIGDTITNGYAVVEDHGIWNEEIPERNFSRIKFKIPKSSDENQIIAMVGSRNIIAGNNLEIIIAGLLGNDKSAIQGQAIISENGSAVLKENVNIKLGNNFSRHSQNLNTKGLSEGIYDIEILINGNTYYEKTFTILPDINLDEILQAVQSNPEGVNMGAQSTLLYKIQQYKEGMKRLNSHDTAEDLLQLFVEGSTEFNLFMNGIDAYTKTGEPYRRAFTSKYDQTLQPYTIKLPLNYDSTKKYPLMVFLHGSGATDEGLLNADRAPDNFIAIAPYGRDMYKAYATPKSQRDIREAIEDAIENFSIDEDKIVVGGFSMGGYGALRTFYEHPDLFKGVAVHAGHPNLANYWLGEGFPNFLDEKYLSVFKNIPVFIYHGRDDGSLPVYLVEQMANSMNDMGINTRVYIEENKGHEYPSPETNSAYFKWLNTVVN